MDQSFVVNKMKQLLGLASHGSSEIKVLTSKLFGKCNYQHVKKIVNTNNLLNEERDRDLEPNLRKWRLKTRKAEFIERINILSIKEMVSKSVI